MPQKPINYIKAGVISPSNRVLCLIEVFLNAQCAAWIEYDYAQLDNLIARLEECKEEIEAKAIKAMESRK